MPSASVILHHSRSIDTLIDDGFKFKYFLGRNWINPTALLFILISYIIDCLTVEHFVRFHPLPLCPTWKCSRMLYGPAVSTKSCFDLSRLLLWTRLLTKPTWWVWTLYGLPLAKLLKNKASYKSGPIQAVRSMLFDERTVETLCNAAINAEDAVACNDAAGNESRYPTSILTEAEKERIFGMVRSDNCFKVNLNKICLQTHSPYYGPLVGLANIVKDSSRMRPGLDLNASMYQPLKQYWSQMIKHVS